MEEYSQKMEIFVEFVEIFKIIDLIINEIKKIYFLIFNKNVFYIKTTGIGRELYSLAKGAKEEMKKNGINSPTDFTDRSNRKFAQ